MSQGGTSTTTQSSSACATAPPSHSLQQMERSSREQLHALLGGGEHTATAFHKEGGDVYVHQATKDTFSFEVPTVPAAATLQAGVPTDPNVESPMANISIHSGDLSGTQSLNVSGNVCLSADSSVLGQMTSPVASQGAGSQLNTPGATPPAPAHSLPGFSGAISPALYANIVGGIRHRDDSTDDKPDDKTDHKTDDKTED